MRIPGLRRLKLSARKLRSRFVNGALILGYHRISDRTSDPYSIGVTPEHFAEQMEVVRRCAYPMALSDLVRSLRDGNLPRRAVVVTFDDGYAETLYVAKPILESQDIPATVFITTGYLGREFWWDELARIIMLPPTLPNQFSLRIGDNRHEWASTTQTYTEPRIIKSNLRLKLLISIYSELLCLSDKTRREILTNLSNWAGLKTQSDIFSRALSNEEIVRLAKGRLIEIGAHTVSHPLLASLSSARQQKEIVNSKLYLEILLGTSVCSFAYPHGSVSQLTGHLVQQAGFSCGCTSINDIARRGVDCFNLPRFWVPSANGSVFHKWMDKWLSK